MDAYNSGDYTTALHEFRLLAEQGHAVAQYNLGLLYVEGKGVSQDYAQAREWYEKAAAQGNANAQYSLGVLYDKGQGLPQDYTQARRWCEKAADQAGHARSAGRDTLGADTRSGFFAGRRNLNTKGQHHE